MNIKIKQNKNSSFVFRAFCMVLASFVLLISISFPSFAYTDTSTNGIDFSDQPVPVGTSNMSASEVRSSGIEAYSWSDYPNQPCSVVSLKDGYDLYCFVYGTSSKSFCVAVESDAGTGNLARYTGIGNDVVSNLSYSAADSSLGLNYGYVGLASIIDVFNVPIFETRDDGLAAVRDWIDNPPGPGVAAPAVAQFVLPAGNAVLIDLGGWDSSNPDKKIQLSQTTQYAHPMSWSTNQSYSYTSSVPSSVNTPIAGQNYINWYGVGKTNLFNQTTDFVSNFIYNPSLGRYLLIVNPFVPEDHDTDNYNAPISVYVGQCSGYKFYQLKSTITDVGSFGGDSDGTTGTGVYDPDTGTWSVTNDETGQPWSPTQGGGNSNNVVLTVTGWLEQISHQISDFFSGAIGAVTNLVGAGSDFIHSLSGLYAWLPAPVYSVLVSALILIITIGVIKVFI